LDYILRFANLSFLYFLIPIVLIIGLLRLKFAKKTIYKYSMGNLLKKKGFASRHPYKKILYLARFFLLVGLVFLIGKPQLVDPRSNVKVEGIDIVVVLDASGSMQMPGYGDDQRTRFDIAKKEAIRFIEKRDNDPIGLVIFGNDALSRCPLTLDKNILKTMIGDLKLGEVIDPRGTVLSLAILTGANRLKNSKSKSKVMILLTDGEPSENDANPKVAIDVAKKLGIRIYTVGIGSDKEEYILDPRYGAICAPKINKKLLTRIAKQTGGKFFHALDEKDMRNIYDTIDKLEKTEYETDIYSKYFDWFKPFLWTIFIVFLLELLFSTFIWFAL